MAILDERLLNVDAVEKALDVALEIDKQIIAISTAVLALTAVFFNDADALTKFQRCSLVGSWVLFAVAVLIGLVVFMIMVGRLLGTTGVGVLGKRDVQVVCGAQIVVFLLAVAAMLVFAIARV